jgi:DNA-binding MarR family transcriptional regulator
MVGDGDETLSEYFWGVARQLRQLSRETLAPWDISPSHSRALSMLLRHGSMRLSDLSDHLRIAPRSATEVVDGLQQLGLVERHPDPHDRRATLVVLTDEGRPVGEAIRSARIAEAERFFGELSETDRAHLTRILRKLNR